MSEIVFRKHSLGDELKFVRTAEDDFDERLVEDHALRLVCIALAVRSAVSAKSDIQPETLADALINAILDHSCHRKSN